MASSNDLPDARNLDYLIHKLIDCYFQEIGKEKPPVQMLTFDEVDYVINRAMDVLRTGSALVEIEAPLCICGDTSYRWPPDQKYLFLGIGDYVDRGPYSIETICLMFLLKWSDPDKSIQGFRPSPRGISYNFGEDVVRNFCVKHSIDLIIRAHQVVHEGYEFFADKKLITIFSAPNYCGQFENMSGTIHVDENLTCGIRQFRPHRERIR